MTEEINLIEESELTRELEREKLLLEIKALKKEWWKKPSYIAALFPTVLVLAVLIFGFTTGYFQIPMTKLENQKHDLQEEINNLEQRKSKLLEQIAEVDNKIKEKKASVKHDTNTENVNRVINKPKNKNLDCIFTGTC